MYVPSIGYCMLLIALLDWLIGHEERQPSEKEEKPNSGRRRSWAKGAIAVTVVVILLFTAKYVASFHHLRIFSMKCMLRMQNGDA